jgi:hypothetical protein
LASRRQDPVGALGKGAKRQRADSNPDKPEHFDAQGFEQTADVPVPAFVQHDLDPAVLTPVAEDGGALDRQAIALAFDALAHPAFAVALNYSLVPDPALADERPRLASRPDAELGERAGQARHGPDAATCTRIHARARDRAAVRIRAVAGWCVALHGSMESSPPGPGQPALRPRRAACPGRRIIRRSAAGRRCRTRGCAGAY